ncbi:MAG: TRAP transporter large permease subunit [Spirochaetaceae bacterium]|nr:TRAP transporter large permease subunit [Spirochaetaceae bacterium]
MKWIVLSIAVLMYVLVIVFQHKKVVFTSAAAILILLLATIVPNSIFVSDSVAEPFRFYAIQHAFLHLINWDVLMIYVGSMIIAAVFIYSQAPARIADTLVSASPSVGIAMVLLLAMTGIISIFVENVATVLVMAPIALALSKKLNFNPTYFLIGLAVMSNLEGTATLVGDPPSMIFAAFAEYTFNDFFFHQGNLSIFFFVQAGMIVGCLFFYAHFRKFREKIAMDPTPIISIVPPILLLAMIVGLAMISFLHLEFHFASGGWVFFLGILAVLWYKFIQRKSNAETKKMLVELDWETILFLVGIFVVVGAISETGLLQDFSEFLQRITGGKKLLGFILIIVVSIIISGFIDNVPYIIVMLPVANSLAQAMSLRPELYLFGLLIGSCLGGNLTPFGASANVVAMGILKKEGYPMEFKDWLKIGLPFTCLTTGAAVLFLWFVWN